MEARFEEEGTSLGPCGGGEGGGVSIGLMNWSGILMRDGFLERGSRHRQPRDNI